MSHPMRLPDSAASGPDTNCVQSPSLSSIQRPCAFFLTMCETFGGGKFVGMSGLIAGLKLVPRFGGGFCPPYGLLVSLTTLGPIPFVIAAPRIVEPLPDSKIAT